MNKSQHAITYHALKRALTHYVIFREAIEHAYEQMPEGENCCDTREETFKRLMDDLDGDYEPLDGSIATSVKDAVASYIPSMWKGMTDEEQKEAIRDDNDRKQSAKLLSGRRRTDQRQTD